MSYERYELFMLYEIAVFIVGYERVGVVEN